MGTSLRGTRLVSLVKTMWQKLLVVAIVALGMGATASAGSPVGFGSADAVQSGPVSISAGDSELTSVQPGEPAIDFTATAAGGINPGMQVVIGNVDEPVEDHAFAVANTAEEPLVVDFLYDYTRAPPSEAGISFAVVNGAGTHLVDPAGSSTSFDLAPGATAYVIVTVDASGATPDDDLSGTLSVTAIEDSTR